MGRGTSSGAGKTFAQDAASEDILVALAVPQQVLARAEGTIGHPVPSHVRKPVIAATAAAFEAPLHLHLEVSRPPEMHPAHISHPSCPPSFPARTPPNVHECLLKGLDLRLGSESEFGLYVIFESMLEASLVNSDCMNYPQSWLSCIPPILRFFCASFLEQVLPFMSLLSGHLAPNIYIRWNSTMRHCP